ncbi:hypothetical protein SDC9_167444 [bioreactor metagenome]|uniref:Uncharacterized protein n=1 Tax=bioreactor metagenome TaxID=1076179 RepID=A0A645FZS1_9ZZZZ
MLCLLGIGWAEGKIIGLAEQRVQLVDGFQCIHTTRFLGGCAFYRQNPHAMCLCPLGKVGPDIPKPDDQEGALPDIVGWEYVLPNSLFHLVVVGEEVVVEGDDHADDMVGYLLSIGSRAIGKQNILSGEKCFIRILGNPGAGCMEPSQAGGVHQVFRLGKPYDDLSFCQLLACVRCSFEGGDLKVWIQGVKQLQLPIIWMEMGVSEKEYGW